MKYELIKKDILAERTIEETDNYEVTITMGIHPTDGIAPNFSKDITVISSNAQTGFQVDDQREQAVTDFMASINE